MDHDIFIFRLFVVKSRMWPWPYNEIYFKALSKTGVVTLTTGGGLLGYLVGLSKGWVLLQIYGNYKFIDKNENSIWIIIFFKAFFSCQTSCFYFPKHTLLKRGSKTTIFHVFPITPEWAYS